MNEKVVPMKGDIIPPETEQTMAPWHAKGFLDEARGLLDERGVEYDTSDGERSMLRAVTAFNALTGKGLTEHEGWLFMTTLKLARCAQNKYHRDSHVDAAAYAALAGESAAR
jgi:hypothetical protein